jgi:hypothetical protein
MVDIRISDVEIEGMVDDGVNASEISCNGGKSNRLCTLDTWSHTALYQ